MRLKVRTLAGMLATLLLLGWFGYKELPSFLYHQGYNQALLQWFPNDEYARPAINRLAMDITSEMGTGDSEYIFVKSSGGASSSGSGSTKLDREERADIIHKLEKLLAQYGHTEQMSSVAYNLALMHFWMGNWDRAESLLLAIERMGGHGWISQEEQGAYLAILESRHKQKGLPSLEGIVRIGDQPVPNAFVMIQRANDSTYYSPPLTHYPATITDENGRYRFYGIDPGEYNVAIGVRTEQINGYYMTETESKTADIDGEATALHDVQFVPQVMAVSPGRNELIQGDELRLQWKSYDGAAYYKLNITYMHRDRSGKYTGATTTALSDQKYSSQEAVFSIREINGVYTMSGKSYGQNGEVTLNTAGLLGMLYPGGEFAWSVDAYDEHDRKLSSSAGYFLHQDAITPIFRVADIGLSEGDRLVIAAQYEEAIEAYKREGDNDHALRVLARLADQGIGKEDGDPAKALAYMERIREPWESDKEFIHTLRDRIQRQKRV
ncbi:carboxypeptidase regulatory-like domain-containing protein [Paenibacillus sp. 1011MAR3C5]|uniref:carboxypeptidase-like regulatory domain-containing protein n=1 Tax=Paenibacillus sp. 1011MAR3C5 TaxID=1675787 RepID=UPI000E6BE687|nr:carboxypeptidase-like regulatory domain-containing protein [Paenibacillus sp. 1011MAR3C5]RJE85682.1 carboxypeptidase regulatory-like domain-containing protein [Paenibacillus sp. 1011MAR3C5]